VHCASKCVLPLSVDFVVAPCTIGNWCELYVEICNVFVVQAGWTVHVVLLVDSTQLDFCDSVNRYEVVHDSLVKPFLVNLLYFLFFTLFSFILAGFIIGTCWSLTLCFVSKTGLKNYTG